MELLRGVSAANNFALAIVPHSSSAFLAQSHTSRRPSSRRALRAARCCVCAAQLRRGIHQVRACNQSQDRQSAWSRSVANAARPRRRGDRVMKRRDFITLLGGAAVAQQGERTGVLMASAADDSENQARMAAFLQGLAQLVGNRWGAIMVEDGPAALLRQPAPHWPSADR